MRVPSLSIWKRMVFFPVMILGVGVDADIEMVVEQVVIGAERPVLAAQEVVARGQGRSGVDRAHVPWRGPGGLCCCRSGASLRLLRGRNGSGAKQAGEAEKGEQCSNPHADMLSQRRRPVPGPVVGRRL